MGQEFSRSLMSCEEAFTSLGASVLLKDANRSGALVLDRLVSLPALHLVRPHGMNRA